MKLLKLNHISNIFIISSIERFVFNGFRSIILVYMIRALMIADQNALLKYGIVMMLSYISAIMGGVIADRILDKPSTTLGGFILMALGCTLMGCGTQYLNFGIVLILFGRGLLRASFLPLLDTAIKEGNYDRNSIFTLFYALMNLANLLGSSFCAIVGEYYSWTLVFITLASFAILGSVFSFLLFKKMLSFPNAHNIILAASSSLAFIILIYTILINTHDLSPRNVYIFFGIIFVLSTVYLYKYSGLKTKFINLVLLLIITFTFFSLYEQSANSIVLLIENLTDRQILIPLTKTILYIPTTLFQSLDPLFNILLGAIIAWIWKKGSQRSVIINPYLKISMGFIFLGLGFLPIIGAVRLYSLSILTPQIILFSILFLVLGEVLIVPTIMARVVELAPRNMVSFCSGLLYFVIGAAQYNASQLFISMSSSMYISKLTDINIFVDFYIYALYICIGFSGVIYLVSRSSIKSNKSG
jgi:proton-dependent oligopeptide transporter, POT family